jgi:hypothetical protein
MTEDQLELEEWRHLHEFPGYMISNYGRVVRTQSELIKVASLNQQGIPNVIFMKNGLSYRRGVALLVAQYFLPSPMRPNFDTPINKDGDRTNNRADNLEWRPRWFAIQYHQQFREPLRVLGRVQEAREGIEFDSIRECAKYYGLLEKDLIECVHNWTPVFPTWQLFQFV